MSPSSLPGSGHTHRALLFAGTLSARDDMYQRARALLTSEFGPAFHETPPAPWGRSHYEDELGAPIKRRFLFFDRLIPEEDIASIKLRTVELEARLAAGGKRTVNIDPGFVNLHQVVLVSTKGYSHRLYMGHGMHAEVTLYFQDGEFRPHLFTYEDFADAGTRAMFKAMRDEQRRRDRA